MGMTSTTRDSRKPTHGNELVDALVCSVLGTEFVDRSDLKAMVWSFTRMVLEGMKVHMIDRTSKDVKVSLLYMTKHLDTLEIRPRMGKGRVFRMVDIDILERLDFQNSAPQIADMEPYCVGIRANLELLFFYFEDVRERDRFLICMKILRMSLDG